MKEIKNQHFTEERALFFEDGAAVSESVFSDGESPLKHSSNIRIKNVVFESRYPIWYSKNIEVKDSAFFKTCRAGIWYTENILLEKTVIDAPKCIRRSTKITLKDVNISSAVETLWDCRDITLKDVTVANGDYFAFNCQNITADNLNLVGQYVFDGTKDVTIKNSRFLTKDAFWNSENVTVYDSFISGEYLGWNAKNLTLINCTVKSLQGLCYIDNLVMKNCTLIDTTLAFEYSDVDVEINGRIESVINPSSGTIKAHEIGELIIEKDRVNPDKTTIIVSGK